MKKQILSFLFLIAGTCGLQAHSLSEKYAPMLSRPAGYVCYQPSDDIQIDGLDNERSWQNAPFTTAFVDISGYNFPKPRYETKARILWDEKYLYIFAGLEEPHVWANLTKRDTIVFYDNDFEVFIDPTGDGHDYFEIETNVRGTVFDLSLPRPYRAPNRPFIQFQWNCPRLKLATHVDGTLNRPGDRDKGWNVEMAIPREAIASEFDNFLKAGNYLRLNFSRVEWQFDLNGTVYSRKKTPDGKYLPEDNWVWTPTGQVAMHMPERWGYVYLSEKKAGEGSETFRYPEGEPVKRFLWMLFYAQEERFAQTHRWYTCIDDFNLDKKDWQLLPSGFEVRVETTSHTYEITVTAPDGKEYVIDESGCCFERTPSKPILAEIPVYVWQGWSNQTTEETLKQDFIRWKSYGVKGVCLNAGFDQEKIRTAARVAKSFGLEYHAWAPCMLQEGLDSTWYAVNRLGQSAYSVQAYVPYYKCLDPRNPQVQEWLIDKYTQLVEIPEVDYVQLDYIRYADVILAKGLWEKYNLVMNEEYPVADYCYCDHCVQAFKKQTGIDIRSFKDPSACKEWAQFRCDAITELVNKIVAAVHAKGKKVSADVFPGPHSYAVWMVRQEWSKWNVDAFFPMNYNDFYLENATWVGKVTKEEVQSVNGKAPVYSGLFICHDWRNKDKVIDPENSGLLPSEIEEAVMSSMKAGAAGISLFTPGEMTDEHWKALEKVIRR